MTTTLNISCSENTMVLSARRGISAFMHVFLVLSKNVHFGNWNVFMGGGFPVGPSYKYHGLSLRVFSAILDQ
jgi:hypothetical protein